MCSKDIFDRFLKVYGISQLPETKEYMIVMQYANGGDLTTYLENKINLLTWKMKLNFLKGIAHCLVVIHDEGLIHCDLHGGNIVLSNDQDIAYICDLGLSKLATIPKPDLAIRGVLPFIAPEIFCTGEYTQKSDVYAFGILMCQLANGEPPFREKSDCGLICEIIDGLRPPLPESTPDPFRGLAEKCCDGDHNKRPNAWGLYLQINDLLCEIENGKHDANAWDAIYYCENLKPLSRAEREGRYSSRLISNPMLNKRWIITSAERKEFILTC